MLEEEKDRKKQKEASGKYVWLAVNKGNKLF